MEVAEEVGQNVSEEPWAQAVKESKKKEDGKALQPVQVTDQHDRYYD
jgi:hypothetical protein